MSKVLITPRSFAKYNQEPYERLKANGFEVIQNPVNDILTKEEMKKYLQDVDGIILGVDPLDQEVLKHANKLKVISKYGVGTDNIDKTYCEENNIAVTITNGANSNAVADYAFTLMLGVARRISEIDSGCHNLDWSKKVAVDVYGKKLGVLGLGAIGKGVVERAKGFHMEVYGYDIYKDETYLKENDITFSEIETMIKECDFISIHLPLLDTTKHLIHYELLKKAKPNLIIVNTARGGIINEDDLYRAIKEKLILGAGIDVFEKEPAHDSKLLKLPQVIVGSHCAASTIDAVDQMSLMAVDNLIQAWNEREEIKNG